MLARMLTFLAVITVVGAPAPARSDDKAKDAAPSVVIRIDSIDNLIEHVKYLAELAGQKDKAEEGLGFFKATVESQKIDKAIDFSRPIGLYGKFNADDLTKSSGAILLPILDEKPLLDLLDQVGMTPEKGEDGVYTVQSMFSPVPIYFRFANKYVYISAQSKDGVAKENILDPSKVFSTGKNSIFSAVFRLDQIPVDLKKMAIAKLEEDFANAKHKEIKGEPKPLTELRHKFADAVAKHATQLIEDAAELDMSFNIDRKEGRLTGDMTFSGKPGSKLAQEISDASKTETLFSGFVTSKSAINLLIHGKLPEDLRVGIGPAVIEGFKNALEQDKDPGKREMGKKFLTAIEPSVKAGELDLALSFRGPSKENHYTFLGALKLKDGEKVEQVLKDLAKVASEKDKAKIHLDAETSGDIKIHKLEVQGDFDEKIRGILGKHPIYVAFRSDAMLVSGGANGLQAIKDGLKAESKAAPVGTFEISMAHLAPLVLAETFRVDPQHLDSEMTQKALQAVRQIFEGGNDKIRITIEGGQVLKGSFVMDAPVVKFLAENMGRSEQKTFGPLEPGKPKPPAKKKPKNEKEKEKEKDKDKEEGK